MMTGSARAKLSSDVPQLLQVRQPLQIDLLQACMLQHLWQRREIPFQLRCLPHVGLAA